MSKNSIYFIVLAIYFAVLLPDFIKMAREIHAPQINIRSKGPYVRVHLAIFLFGLSLTFYLVLLHINIFNYGKPIPYDRLDRITFKDFRGLNLTNKTVEGGSEFASIYTTIDAGFEDETLTITSMFHPSRSYTYAPNLQNEKLLTHEMYHFHITEKWARIFRKRMKEFSVYPGERVLNSVNLEILKNLNREQRAYDFETNHSYLLGNQIEWQQRIDSALQKLEEFGNTQVNFNKFTD